MKQTRLLQIIGQVGVMLTGLLFAITSAQAQTIQVGTVEGRVLNIDNGRYLTNARVTVAGTQIEAFTDSAGLYRLVGVPAGSAKVKAFYTGLAVQESVVNVSSGQTVECNFNLAASSGLPAADDKAITLDVFTVAAKRETDGAAIAINEQRFAPAIKNVVSTDTFGDVVEGNIGDFAKFLPGVSIDYTANDARSISLRGVAATFTSVTMDGNKMASASSSSPNRTFELEQVSLNNTSRIEIFKSRTPDISADALGGSVNLVSRSAFEQVKPSLRYRAFATLNGAAEKSLHNSPGPDNDSSRKVKPGFDLVYIRPVTKNFGFTLSLLESNIYNTQDYIGANWSPSIVPVAGLDLSKPFLGNINTRIGPKITKRESVGLTTDWRFAPNDILTVGVQWNNYYAYYGNRQDGFDIGYGTMPAEYNQTMVHGQLGRGVSSIIADLREKSGITYSTNLGWRHNGPVWKLDGGLSFSHASNHYKDAAKGHFDQTRLNLRGLPRSTNYSNYNPTVWFDGLDKMGYLVPQSVTVFESDNTLNRIDTANPANYNLVSATVSPLDSSDVFKTARLNARREFQLSFPFSIKAGLQVQQQTRDIRGDNPGTFTFVGPDHVAHTADDNASLYDLVDKPYSSGKFAFGTPQIVMPDPYKSYKLYLDHPDYWTLNPTSIISNTASASRWLQETITATYMLGDARLFDGRMRVVGGVRFERTKDEGQGQRINNIGLNNITDPDPTQQAIKRARAQYIVRGAQASKTYDGSYPSLDMAYNITPSLIARAALAKSIGRQNLSNIIPTMNVPDPSSTSKTITVSNTALKPTMCNNYDLSLEHYFSKTGIISVGVFKKEFSDFSGARTVNATSALLNEFGVPNPDAYSDGTYFISTRLNAGDATITGVEFNYSQVLDMAWMPVWARNFSVFLNGQRIHLEGTTLADFNNFIRSTTNFGVKYNVRKFSAQVNVNMRGRQRQGVQTWAPGAYTYNDPRTFIDGNLEYRWLKQVQFFLNVRNLTNNVSDNKNYAPGTPDYARTVSREIYGAQYAIGVKGQF